MFLLFFYSHQNTTSLPTTDLPPHMLTLTPTTALVTTDRPMTATPNLTITKATASRHKVTKSHNKTKPSATTKAPLLPKVSCHCL